MKNLESYPHCHSFPILCHLTDPSKIGLAMRLFLLMRIDAHQMRINAHKPHQ